MCITPVIIIIPSRLHGDDSRTAPVAFAFKSFLYMGAKVYNELPLDIRQTEIYKEFVEKIKVHFI